MNDQPTTNMSDIVIKAESLGKKYTIGHQSTTERYTALRDVIMRQASGFWRKSKDLFRGKAIINGDELEEVWALKDVSFEVKQGEILGHPGSVSWMEGHGLNHRTHNGATASTP